MQLKNRYLIIPVFLFCIQLNAQPILIDRGVRANGLWCFPQLNDSTKYLYLPGNPHLALDSKNRPQFSFVRYVKNVASSQAASKSITEAQGGAVLHFIITYDTPQETIDAAQEELRQVTHIPNVQIIGPIIYKDGRFTLVSSILMSGQKEPLRKIISTGQAPVLEGGRIALSFEMTPERSKLLLESFKMATPDISVLFEMTFSGLSDAYDAKLTVKWEDVYKSEQINKKSSFLFVSNDVTKTCEELRRSQAIDLVVSGDDKRMDEIVNHAYAKITDLLFSPLDPEQFIGKDQQQAENQIDGQLDVLGLLKGAHSLNLKSNQVYKLKEFKNTGNSILTFNSRFSFDRFQTMVFNMGDVFKKYGNDIKYFRSINMDDPDFQQREIYVNLDGDVLPEFDKIIDNVTVTLRKIHEHGDPTIKEINLTKGSLNSNEMIGLIYGNEGDKDRENWLKYDYKANYAFKGGKSYDTGWINQGSAMINLHPPYERRIIQLDGDLEDLKRKNVRAVNVQIGYLFLGEQVKIQQTVKVNSGFEGKAFELLLPKNNFEYQYKVSWFMQDGSQKEQINKSSSGILFVDNIPVN